MNGRNISLGITFLVILIAIAGVFYFANKSTNETFEKSISNPLMKRQVVQMPLSGAGNNSNQPSVEASKLPEFIFSLADSKFDSIVNAASGQVSQLAQVHIVHTAYAKNDIETHVSVDKEKRQLVVRPEDIPNFQPGMYHLSLTLRTLEGVVNIDQDFSWGVVAVNTNKSIYKPGETAKIGFGVLNDNGETLCKYGLFNHVDALSMIVTDPKGKETTYSLKDNTIKDSGECGANTVTNDADFQATYQTTTPGIYQMKVTAVVYGKSRSIEDYFKVDSGAALDVERTSFPTRIYPLAPYPVTFTVTANHEYQGTVEDIVPANFGIEQISDGGVLQKDGDFTRIVWNVNLKAGEAKEFTYFVHFPRVSPEFYLIGPIKIGNFQEARQWQVASDAINSSTGQVTYEDNGTQNTWYRLWTGTTWNPTTGTNANGTSMSSGAGTPTNSKWFREVSSPLTSEKLVAILDADTTDVIYVYRWTGSGWTNDIKVTLTVTTLNPTRGMDIAYEQLSGDAVFVYSDGSTNQLHYYKRVSGTWDVSASNAGTAFTAVKSWVRMAPESNSDNILLGYVNNSNFIGAMIWDGTNNVWTNQISDNAGTTTSGHADETIALAWESSTNVPMIMWATSGARVDYERFTGTLASGTWSSPTDTGHTYAANVAWINAASDPRVTSNNIAIGTVNSGTATCEFAVWNGSSWSYGTSVTCNNNAHRSINVAFESTTGHALWVYVSSADATHLRYTLWNGSSFSTSNAAVFTTPTQTNPLSIEMYSDPNTAGIVVIYDVGTGTGNTALWDVEWDGSSWSAAGGNNGGVNLFANVQGANETAEAFGFGFDQYLETLASYKFFANADSTDVGSALAAQNTPFGFNSANPDFRLRLLLYYNANDSVGSGARSYKLQFVDPGSGSCSSLGGDGTPSDWTDVGTGSSTSIAYKDNATPADGANLTANSSDPTYSGKTVKPQTYEEQNNFSNSTSAISGDQAGEWDFALHDNTTFDKNSSTFCFRVTKDTGRVLSTLNYPQITTASTGDALIQGGSNIQGGSLLQ